MAADLSDPKALSVELLRHIGHTLRVIDYPDYAVIECETCAEVVIDGGNPDAE